jgi:alkylation response protein AidB-like acyl-CoA dehydrogenase
VPWGAEADDLLVVVTGPGGDLLVAVDPDPERCERHPGRNLADEPRDRLVFHEARAHVVGPVARDEVWAAGALLRAAQLVGATEAVVASTLTHAHTREQFGRPLVRFQAVGSLVAVVTAQLVVARAALHDAVAWSSERPDPERVAVAFSVAARAAGTVARGAHQVHGAMGVTREHGLHRSTRRLWAWREEFGGARGSSARLGAALADSDGEDLWRWVTAWSPDAATDGS